MDPQSDPVIVPRYDDALPISLWHDEIARDHRRAPGRGHRRRDRLGQDHPAAQDLPGARPSLHRPHPAATDRGPQRGRAGRRGAGEPLGELVGYQVRFTRKASAETRLKIMTDGVLLAEIRHDRDLRRYDTIIIDEAHERSLNIDFLLGYLKRWPPADPISRSSSPPRPSTPTGSPPTSPPPTGQRADHRGRPAARTRSRSATARSWPTAKPTRSAASARRSPS